MSSITHSDEMDMERQQLEHTLDRAAEIERVAREVVRAYFMPSPTGTLSVAVTRLRTLVQP